MSINDLLYKYLVQEGYSGALQEMWMESDLGQMTNDELYTFLKTEGYTGTVNDMLYAFLVAETTTEPPVED